VNFLSKTSPILGDLKKYAAFPKSLDLLKNAWKKVLKKSSPKGGLFDGG